MSDAVLPNHSSLLAWSERPGRALLKLAWPITVSMVSFSTMTLVSTAFVAQVGKDELAGVGLAGVIGFALVCFGIGLLRGAKTLVSQAVGAGRRDRIPDLLTAALGIALVLALLAVVVGQLVAPLLVQLSASPRAGGFAAEYLAIRSLGTPLALVYAALREARYGVGDTRAPMRASIAGNLVNVTLDCVLILGLHMSVRGAAIAAICGNATELAMLAVVMLPQLRRLRWRWGAVRDVWAQGVPNGLQFVMEVGSFLILTVCIARMSALDGAACARARRSSRGARGSGSRRRQGCARAARGSACARDRRGLRNGVPRALRGARRRHRARDVRR